MSPLENAWNDISPDAFRVLRGQPRPPLLKVGADADAAIGVRNGQNILEAAELRAMRNFDTLNVVDPGFGGSVTETPECNEVFHFNLATKEIEGDDWTYERKQSEDKSSGLSPGPSDAREEFDTARRTKYEQVLVLEGVPSASKVKKTGNKVMWYNCSVSPAVFTEVEVLVI